MLLPRYWSDRWRGWHFYEDPMPEERERPPLPDKVVPAAPPALPSKAPELVEFERLQKTLEDTRNIAIMRPTEANVRRYMELESQVVARASYFADVAQRVAWATPALDPTLQGRPVNAKALEVFEQTELVDRSRSIAELGKDHVLFFFYRSDCPYCHAFAPTLAAFQARHGIQVVAISVDGGPMPGFPNARPDNGIATTLKVTRCPPSSWPSPSPERSRPSASACSRNPSCWNASPSCPARRPRPCCPERRNVSPCRRRPHEPPRPSPVAAYLRRAAGVAAGDLAAAAARRRPEHGGE
jgi:conjugal transfer pilus assembly protein TraF